MQKKLPTLLFLPAASEDAFGFVDPADIIRAVHMLPGFAAETTLEPLASPSVGRVRAQAQPDRPGVQIEYVSSTG